MRCRNYQCLGRPDRLTVNNPPWCGGHGATDPSPHAPHYPELRRSKSRLSKSTCRPGQILPSVNHAVNARLNSHWAVCRSVGKTWPKQCRARTSTEAPSILERRQTHVLVFLLRNVVRHARHGLLWCCSGVRVRIGVDLRGAATAARSLRTFKQHHIRRFQDSPP
jgi:hypothetical protein